MHSKFNINTVDDRQTGFNATSRFKAGLKLNHYAECGFSSILLLVS